MLKYSYKEVFIIKTYYQTLSKEEKEKIKKEYQNTYQHTDIDIRLKRVNILIIISILAAILLLVMSYIYEDEHLSSIIIAGVLIATAITFVIASNKIKHNIYNKIALQKKAKK